ncbi:MAG: hypothetical protein ACO1O6_11400 [Bacteroidota bacterium]
MKQIFRAGIVLLGLTTLSLTSCKKEGCMDALAENYDSESKKDNGSCTFARTKFMGAYSVNQECVFDGTSSFNMSVTDGPNADEILINNFGNYGVNIRAKVNGGNITFKEEQTGITYEGSGYIVGNTLTITYEACETFFYPCSDPESCTMTCTK